MGINLFYENLSLDATELKKMEKRLINEYGLKVSFPYNYDSDVHSENKKKLLCKAIIKLQRGLSEVLKINMNDEEGKGILEGYTNHLLGKLLLNRDFYLSYYLKICYAFRDRVYLSNSINSDFYNDIPYRINESNGQTIPNLGKSFQSILNSNSIFNTIDRNDSSAGKRDISRFSLPNISKLYAQMTLDDLESHALFELSVGFVLSYSIYSTIVTGIMMGYPHGYRFKDKSYNLGMMKLLDMLRDSFYSHIVSIPFPGLRVNSVNLLLSILTGEMSHMHEELDRGYPFKEQLDMIGKMSEVIESLYSSREFEDYHYFCWLLYLKSEHGSVVDKDYCFDADKLLSYVESDCSAIKNIHMIMEQSSIYFDVDIIRRQYFDHWYYGSGFFSDYDRLGQSDPVLYVLDRWKKGEYVNHHATLEEDRQKAYCKLYEEGSPYRNQFEDNWKSLASSSHRDNSHRYIKLDGSALDFDKLYCIIQNDISRCCQKEYEKIKANKDQTS